MNLTLWDEELKAIATDTATVKQHYHALKREQRHAIVKYKVAILQLQGTLSAILEKMAHATQRKAALPPGNRSLVHWGGVLAQKTHQFYFLYVQLTGKTMWLNLLRARIPGNHHAPDAAFSDEQLVELANRMQRLTETEQVLSMELAQLNRQREQLEYRYQDLCAIEQNRQAASSLAANFGSTVRDALKHPLLESVRSLFWSISHQQSYRRKRGSYLNEVHASVEKRTETIIHNCRNLVIENLRDPSRHVRKREIDQYRESLAHIEELQQQLADASALLLEAPSESRPILLKSRPNSGTTLAIR
jgi:phage-related tail protein